MNEFFDVDGERSRPAPLATVINFDDWKTARGYPPARDTAMITQVTDHLRHTCLQMHPKSAWLSSDCSLDDGAWYQRIRVEFDRRRSQGC